MSDTTIDPKLQTARRGSKKGWPTRATQLPPDLDAKLDELAQRRAAAGQPHQVTDLLREAVEAYLPRALRRLAA